ncbi:MAG: M24 family metallopeptidase [Erysipelotrichaceae bacterium]|nr:M24 family metallopeptidase [Erysipelotrichaceae bacterium]
MISKQDFLIKESVNAGDLKAKVISYRQQEEVYDRWLDERFETVLPAIMKRSGIDTWVVACEEYNEDPVVTYLTPMFMVTARRKMILLFHLEEDGKVRKIVIGRPHIGLDGRYEEVWVNQKGSIWCKDPSRAETQMECLNRMLHEVNAQQVGLNMSKTFAFADGLSKTLYDEIYEGLDDEMRSKICSAENIAVGWLETRCESEIAAYNGIVQIAHSIIDEAFSNRVITPGITTNLDVKYFMLQKTIELGLQPWFDYDVSINRPFEGSTEDEKVIMPGDVLHCDIGFRYLGLCTDTQELCYVCRPGETDAPQFLKDCMRDVNRFQDIVISNFRIGRTGNEVLLASLKQGKEAGLKPCLYSHPIGTHGHGAGPTIGLVDQQNGVKGAGDYPLYDNTCYSLELNCAFDLKEQWGSENVRFGMESDILFKNGEVYFLAGRQESFHLVK